MSRSLGKNFQEGVKHEHEHCGSPQKIWLHYEHFALKVGTDGIMRSDKHGLTADSEAKCLPAPLS
jgi:hypothetical protein